MTASTVLPAPLPESGSGAPSVATAAEHDGPAPLDAYEVFTILQEHSARVHAELQALRDQGEPIAVPAQGVVLCELVGLIVDLPTGRITGIADDFVAPVPRLRERLTELFGPQVLGGVIDTAIDSTAERV